MPFKYWPDIETCCVCIPSLRTAATIIAVLALVSNPLLSWLMIRHSYAVRVSCRLSGASRTDVVDININNVISFGFGVNGDLGISCLTQSQDGERVTIKIIKALGWIVLIADVAFLVTSMLFLVRIYRNPTRRMATAFIISGLIALVLSSIHGIMYVIVCAIQGQGIALCQLLLTFVDLGLWIYFFLVIQFYIKKELPSNDSQPRTKNVRQEFAFLRTKAQGPMASGSQAPGVRAVNYRGRSFMNALRDCCQWIANIFRAAERRAAGAEASDVVRRARRDWAGGPRPGTTAWISARRLPARADTAVTLRRVGP
ncbi:uncharacterized protein LOC134655266 [Cydia amplana]|uniref:uncharacterized protein LOC134655266 n=1 Tax=Cydia amplana TaxID=1869771 RepID=UPI002FE5FBDD